MKLAQVARLQLLLVLTALAAETAGRAMYNIAAATADSAAGGVKVGFVASGRPTSRATSFSLPGSWRFCSGGAHRSSSPWRFA
jgi:hypothetical protein